jgi:hypothetical protein
VEVMFLLGHDDDDDDGVGGIDGVRRDDHP